MTSAATQTSQRDLVLAYFDGIRTSDHARILATLTDDVEWVIHGHRTTRGKAEFDGEIENPAFTGSPQLELERVREDVRSSASQASAAGRASPTARPLRIQRFVRLPRRAHRPRRVPRRAARMRHGVPRDRRAMGRRRAR